MAADDRIKPAVVAALVKDGWTITHDPYPIEYRGERLSVDLGAERSIIAAERTGERIAVEIKSFLGLSIMTDFYACLGQYLIYKIYKSAMEVTDPDRKLVVAVSDRAYANILNRQMI